MIISRNGFWTAFAMGAILASWSAGCQEPNYRNEVVVGQQGHVEVDRVAKDRPAAIAPSDAPSVGPAATNSNTLTTDQKIQNLEEQERRLNDEITKLKLQKETESR